MADFKFKETSDAITSARFKLQNLGKLLNVDGLREKIVEGEKEASDPSFWTDSVRAKKRSKELNDVRKTLEQYDRAHRELEDLTTHIELAAEMEDTGELNEVLKGLNTATKSIAELDTALKLSGEFDNNDAIFSLHLA